MVGQLVNPFGVRSEHHREGNGGKGRIKVRNVLRRLFYSFDKVAELYDATIIMSPIKEKNEPASASSSLCMPDLVIGGLWLLLYT